MLHIAVLGYGYWGPNLVRNFIEQGVQVSYIVDTSQKRQNIAVMQYPAIPVTDDITRVLNDTAVDAVAIALPVERHYETAKCALKAGKHVLIEKPMTDNPETAVELIELADQKNKVLMVDHTFLYTGAVAKIRSLLLEGSLGELRYFDSTRVNLGLFQSDINVVWDLAPHDLSILSYLYAENPAAVAATGISHTENNLENIAYLTLFYHSNFIAHVSVSWISPVKIRRILIGGSDKMVVYDDIEPTEKVKIYDSTYKITTYEDRNRIQVDYRTGDILVPKIDTTEALQNMALDFKNAVIDNTKPVSDCMLGYNVVKLLSAAEESIRQKGREVVV